MSRSYDRSHDQLRPVKVETNVNEYAEGSVIISFGKTKVLCTASVEESIPGWLKGKGQGWITAEYSMLPRATHTRTKRERAKISGRTSEIQRLIGRALRACIDMDRLGERTIMIDCDVLQADGGTRTASITGGYIALELALKKVAEKQGWNELPIIDKVAAVSVGIKEGTVLVDLDYDEDSSCDVDMNFVMTGAEKFVEIQGTAEKKAFSKKEMEEMTSLASKALSELHQLQTKTLK